MTGGLCAVVSDTSASAFQLVECYARGAGGQADLPVDPNCHRYGMTFDMVGNAAELNGEGSRRGRFVYSGRLL